MYWKGILKKSFLAIGLDVRVAQKTHDRLVQNPAGHQNCSFLEGLTPERKFIVTKLLYARLGKSSLADFNELIQGNDKIKSLLADVPEEHYRREVLRLGTHYIGDDFNRETGLSPFNPPKNVHAMVREDIYCGDLYYCDLITEVLDDIGRSIGDGDKILDFGCSSGRVIKTLQAAYPGATFIGCDPNQEAIAWASKEMPSAQFFVSAEVPPIAAPNHAYDIVYAISIWSHFSERAALRWFEEMHRIIVSGGFLIFTTHGFGSLQHYLAHGAMSQQQTEMARQNMHIMGVQFMDVFGPDGDWGVGKFDWGQSFFSPAWFIDHLTNAWDIILYKHRRSENNQDVYVLKRK